MYIIPSYTPPDFFRLDLVVSPVVCVKSAPADGVVPDNVQDSWSICGITLDEAGAVFPKKEAL